MARRIALAHPDADVRERLAAAAKDLGADVDVHPDGGSVLERVRAGRAYDLVYAHPDLGGASGYELCWRLREEAGTPVVLVGRLDAGAVRRARLVGAADILEEPVRSSALREQLAALEDRAPLSGAELWWRLERRLEGPEETQATDRVTGLLTHAAGLGVLDREVERARSTRLPLSVLVLELPEWADRVAAGEGDRMLARLGAAVTCEVRDRDQAARLGEARALVILPSTDQAGAAALGRRLAAELSIGRAGPGQALAPSMTLRVGIATRLDDDPATGDELIRRALGSLT